MMVYHGSYCIVDKPHISYSRETLDFGRGFYTTTIEKQAIDWTNRFKVRGQSRILNMYDLFIEDIKQKYSVKEFLSYDLEWLDFILACRQGDKSYSKYDVIIGGIADDRVYGTIGLYADKIIDKNEALKRLKFFKPNNQICIVNQEVIDKYLRFKGSDEL